MERRQREYDAFISYRHREPDRAVAVRLQEMLETYVPPRGIVERGAARKLHLFRDEDELPMSADLSADIAEALASSRFLICICSPEYPTSRWCMREVDRFKELHGGSTSNIIALIAEGDPHDVFPEQLLHETRWSTDESDVRHAQEIDVEPLAGNVAAPTVKESLKKLEREYLRVAAPLLGVGFDDLYDRDARRRARRMWTLASSVVAASLLFAGWSGAMLARIRQQHRALQEASVGLLRRDAWSSLEAASPVAAARSALAAMDAQDALRGRADHETERIAARAASLYRSSDAPETIMRKTFRADLSRCLYSADGRTLLVYDLLDGLTLLDATTGTARSRRPGLDAPYLLADDRAAYCGGLHGVHAIALEDGEDLWAYRLADRYATIADMCIHEDTIALAIHGTSAGGSAVFLDCSTGRVHGACDIPWRGARAEARFAMDDQGRLWCAFATDGVCRVCCAAPDGTARHVDVALDHPVRSMLCDGDRTWIDAIEDLSSPSSPATLCSVDASSMRILSRRAYQRDGMGQHGGAPSALLARSGGRVVATAQSDVRLFDRDGGEELASWTLGGVPTGAFDTGRGVALYGPGGAWHLPDGAGHGFDLARERFATFPADALSVAAHGAGRSALIRREDRGAVELRVASPSLNFRAVYGDAGPYQRLPAMGGVGCWAFRVTVGLSGERMVFPVTTDGGTSVWALDAEDEACRRLFDVAQRGPFDQIDFVRALTDGRVLCMGTCAVGDLFVLCEEDGTELDRLELPVDPNERDDFLWDVDGQSHLATSRHVVWCEGATIVSHRPEAWRYTAFDAAEGGRWAAAIVDEGGASVVYGEAGQFDGASRVVAATGTAWRAPAPVERIALSPQGRRIAACVADVIYLYDVEARSLREHQLSTTEGVARMLFVDEETLLVLTRDGALFACPVDAGGPRVVAELFTRTGTGAYMERFRDGLVLVQTSGEGWAIDWRAGEIVAELPHLLCGSGKLGKLVAFEEANGGERSSDYARHGYRLYLGDWLDASALRERCRSFLAAFGELGEGM